MATLQKIRNHGPIIAIVIGLALFAFILNDLFTSGRTLMGNSQFEIAQINGKSYSYQDFEKLKNTREKFYKLVTRRSSLDAQTTEQIQDYVWEQMVRNAVLNKQYEELGIDVSADELYDMIRQGIVTPMIRDLFTNPQTNFFDPNLVFNYVQNMDNDQSGDSKFIWLYLEDELKDSRKFVKYTNMIIKGLYATDKEAEYNYKTKTHLVDFNFASKSYNSVPDSVVHVPDNEITEYYRHHKKEFYQQEGRDINYVVFDVIPTAEDSAMALKDLEDLIKPFMESDDAFGFASANSYLPVDKNHYKRNELPTYALDSVMFANPTDSVYGPYIYDGAYNYSRLVERVFLPDSVKLQEMAIVPDGNVIKDMDRAEEIADSLINLMEKDGIDFGSLAVEYSADTKTAKDSGMLDWITEQTNLIPEIKEKAFAPESNIGNIYKIKLDGAIFIIKVLDKTKPIEKVQVATIAVTIDPSKATYDDVYLKAVDFAANNRTAEKFQKAAEDKGLVVREAPNIAPSTKAIPGLSESRELIRWAYKADVGDVSEVIDLKGKYVVAVLSKIREQGYADEEQVKDFIKAILIKEKKGEKLAEQFKNTDLTSVEKAAQAFGSNVLTAKNITLFSFQLPNSGYEPKVIAKALNMQKGEVSKVIKGKNAIYVIQVTSVTPSQSTENVDLKYDKETIEKDYRTRATYQAYDALLKQAHILDRRIKFY